MSQTATDTARPPLLSVQGLRKHYPLSGAGPGALARWLGPSRHRPAPRLHAVDGVSFEIGRGESLGLVGESGCGKSTLVGLLARLSEPSAGQILLAGRDIGAVPAGRFNRGPDRGRVQVVFQDAQDSLNPRFSAFAAIADPLRRIRGLRGAALRHRVEEVADQVGLPRALLGRFPHQLSGGQKARVNIGRAVAVSPQLLILDEPTSALDVSVQAVILKLLARLREELSMSYLFVSHDLNVVRMLCDRVLVMYLGKVVESGPAGEVFASPAHPYTQALIAAIPDHRARGRPRAPLGGEPMSPVDPDPDVCRFYGRCPRGQSLCGRRYPPLEATPGADGAAARRRVACHFADPAPGAGRD